MASRVLATQEALDACNRMKNVVNGPLVDNIDRLNTQGQVLSERNQWDGPRAQQFRQDWQQMHQSLVRAKESVEELRAQADQILAAIMQAGGF